MSNLLYSLCVGRSCAVTRALQPAVAEMIGRGRSSVAIIRREFHLDLPGRALISENVSYSRHYAVNHHHVRRPRARAGHHGA